MYCEKCGLALKKNQNYCPNCGNRIVKDIDSSSSHRVRITGLLRLFVIICPLYCILKISAIYLLKTEQVVTGIWYFDLLNAVIAVLFIIACIALWIHKRIGIDIIKAGLIFSLITDIGLIMILFKKNGIDMYINDWTWLFGNVFRLVILFLLIVYFAKSKQIKYYSQQLI